LQEPLPQREANVRIGPLGEIAETAYPKFNGLLMASPHDVVIGNNVQGTAPGM
jgi:hypothetical protein